jgi:hypothetical protein
MPSSAANESAVEITIPSLMKKSCIEGGIAGETPWPFVEEDIQYPP